MRNYELMMIIDPTLSDDDRNALLAEIKADLEVPGTTITAENHWGVRDLAYKINNSSKGFYLLFTLTKESGHFFDVIKHFNLKKAIWRHMFVRIDE